jgi:GH15 family glucan-1,4-alpha-glucosidase
MGFTPIEDYGVIGNLETCPLIGRDGSIDWCCFPHIESSSVFASILDDEGGGHFAVQPATDFESEQAYVTQTNVLQTEFRTDSGTLELTDFMPVSTKVLSGHTPSAIYRKATCTEGTIEVDVGFAPRFDYERAGTTVEETSEGVLARGNGEQLYLWSPVSFETSEGETEHATASVSLGTDETVWLVLQYNDREPREAADCEALLREVIDYWQEWTHQCLDESGCRFGGSAHENVIRSGLMLRLLMNPQTHAIAAAPTTSLPEEIGGIRNWDYRYAWIRDAAFTIQALYELGHDREARNGFDWCLTMCHKDDPGEIGHPLYGLHYPASMTETTLDHLSGYRDSVPVRVGNKAGDQDQLDTYGELIMAIYTATNYGENIFESEWEVLREVIEYVCGVWMNKDSGIWEARSEPKHNVHSKVLCWAAIDRGIRIAEENDFNAPFERWKDECDAIREAVLDEGFDEDLGSFTQTFEGETVDAAALRIAGVGFLPFDDDRIQGTIDAVMDYLMTDEGLVQRYEGDDGLPGKDNPFVLCTFWLVDCLALSGRIEEARDLFESTMQYASPLGLFAEEIDPETGEHRGNFPQAFSHIGLINSTLYLNKAEEGETSEPIGIQPAERYQSP